VASVGGCVFLQCREGVGGAAESCHCVRRVLCGACGRYVVVSDDGSGEKCAHAREKAELCDLGMWLGFLGSFPPPPPRFWMSLKPASSCITTFFCLRNRESEAAPTYLSARHVFGRGSHESRQDGASWKLTRPMRWVLSTSSIYLSGSSKTQYRPVPGQYSSALPSPPPCAHSR
jgi:hypothetical protein